MTYYHDAKPSKAQLRRDIRDVRWVLRQIETVLDTPGSIPADAINNVMLVAGITSGMQRYIEEDGQGS